MGASRRRGAGLGRAVLLALAALGLGAAAAPQDFPASSSDAEILRWVKARTSIDRGTILSVGPQAVIAFERKTGSLDNVVSAEVREELIGPELAARAQARSVRITLELDCGAHRYRILGRTLFALTNLEGQGRNEAGSQGWAQVDETAPIGRAWQAVCTPGFLFPYASAPPTAAATTTPSKPDLIEPTAKAKTAAIAKPTAPRSGDYEVLLGSYSVPANAQGAAAKLTRRFAEALAGRKPSISPVTVSGKSYSAVRVGPFATAPDASSFCTRIKASGLVCVVKTKESAKPAPF